MMGKEVGESSSNQIPPPTKTDENLPVGTKLFSPRKEKISEKKVEKAIEDEDMLTDNIKSDGISSLNINCNVVSVLPYVYD